MKRFTLALIALCLAFGAGAQELKVGTIQGTAMYGPLFVKVLKDAGFDAAIVTFNEQPELIAALAKREIDGAFFLAQPIIAQINGAIMVSARLHQTDFCAVTTDPSIKINSPADLKNYTVGIVTGNMAHEAIARGVQTVASASDMEQFKRLAAGDFQVALSVDKLAQIMSKAAGLESFYVGDRPLLRTPTFFALSGSQAANKTIIENVFIQWQKDGKWEAEISEIDQAAR